MAFLGFFSSRLPNVEALKAEQDIKELIRLLDHHNVDIQWQSADALGSLGTIATLPLIAALNHRKTAVRLGAIEALGTIRDQRSGIPLIYLLEQDENAEVRWVAALALGNLGSPEAINPLVRALKDPDRYVRYGAAQALQSLTWVPQTDTERAYYSIAFQDWKDVAQIGAGATGPLIETLQDQNVTTRAEVVEVLGEIGDTPSQRACELVLKDPSSTVRWKAILAAKKCGVPVTHLPRGLSKRPRSGQNPWAAAILNFLFLGLGYNYLGYWWGFLVFMSYMSILVLSQMAMGPFIPYLIVYPVTALFAVQTFFLAKRKEYM
ncbi:MAG TPA: HEAT repeat domain-containing protein [Methanoregula sp.]|nr:HEAT repeat domain-containing protein [Methanoregula sp.]